MKNYLTYPTSVMNITQNYSNSYSHAPHSQGYPADYPIDDACADGGRSWFYCPCDEMRVAHIYGVGKSGTNTIWIESTSKVVMPCGEDFVTIQVIHPNDDTLAGIKKGQTFKRGEKMFLEGNDGKASGYHFHIAVGTGKFTGTGWVQNSKSAWVNVTTGKQIRPEDAFWVDDSFTTVKNTCGIVFKHILMGDVDGDGKITSADARIALRAAVGMENLTDKQKMAADMDGDGNITTSDARDILRKSVGLDG